MAGRHRAEEAGGACWWRGGGCKGWCPRGGAGRWQQGRSPVAGGVGGSGTHWRGGTGRRRYGCEVGRHGVGPAGRAGASGVRAHRVDRLGASGGRGGGGLSRSVPGGGRSIRPWVQVMDPLIDHYR
jgi:hypothetical protein